MNRERIAGLKGSWEWLEFAAQLPAKPVPLVSLAASGALYSGRCILAGASVTNTATTAGQLNLLDGTDSKGQIVSVLPLAAGAAAYPVFGPAGVLMELGVFATVTTATITGSVYVIPLWHEWLTPPGE